jgi:oxygen-independent coproporphyrinogen-3 oxidase
VTGNFPAYTEESCGPGLYLHVPFCAHRCHYCDFNTYAGLSDLIPRYVEALRADLRAVAAAGPPGGGEWPEFGSVFVGGGTPTLLPPDDLAGVLRLAREVLPVAGDAEVTVEANPETVTAGGMATLVEAGMTRLSMGVQSFAPHVLAALGRRHDAGRPLKALADARTAGVARINLDLIYGTPGETDADWDASLRIALQAGVTHVSAYALTVEPATEYAARIRAGLAQAPDEDTQAERMAVADRALRAAGLRRYEVSNWAEPGEECRHNLVYWRGGDWLGVGAGAHGHWAGRRWWSLRSPARYADAALAGQDTTAGAEALDEAARRTERLMLGLRLAEGVDLAAVEPLDPAGLRELTSAGLVTIVQGRLRLTDAGWPLTGAITLRLLNT